MINSLYGGLDLESHSKSKWKNTTGWSNFEEMSSEQVKMRLSSVCVASTRLHDLPPEGSPPNSWTVCGATWRWWMEPDMMSQMGSTGFSPCCCPPTASSTSPDGLAGLLVVPPTFWTQRWQIKQTLMGRPGWAALPQPPSHATTSTQKWPKHQPEITETEKWSVVTTCSFIGVEVLCLLFGIIRITTLKSLPWLVCTGFCQRLEVERPISQR